MIIRLGYFSSQKKSEIVVARSWALNWK
uniref:Uncharacterized protein n=1 Tax=Arundo donax TaxID=35708 RepID=A0A0A9BAA0_ARUDO